MANPFRPSGINVALRESLSEGAARTGTTLDIDPIITKDGHRVTMADIGDICFGKIDEGTNSEEIISWTGMTDNTTYYTLTGVVWGINFYNNTGNVDANKKRHDSGAKFIITNDDHFLSEQYANKDATVTVDGDWTITGEFQFPTGGNANAPKSGTVYSEPTNDLEYASKKYIDNVAIAGAAKATDTTYGIAKLSTAAASATVPIAVGDNDGRVPTTDEKAAMAGTSGTPSATNKYVTESYLVGMIIPYAGATAPTGFLLADGAAVSRTTYAALFAVIADTYGVGDGTTTFNLPDLKGRVAVGKSTDTEFDALGETGGEKTHVLTVAELAAHTHSEPYSIPMSGGAAGTVYSLASSNIDPTKPVTSSTGSNTAHNNLQPYITLNYIIKY